MDGGKNKTVRNEMIILDTKKLKISLFVRPHCLWVGAQHMKTEPMVTIQPLPFVCILLDFRGK